MTKRVFFLLSGVLLAALPAFAQDSKKASTCSGSISADGLMFTCDKDHHVWKVSNPDALRDLEGHQAKLRFRRSAIADEIFVTAASVIQQQQTLTANHGDSAFRR